MMVLQGRKSALPESKENLKMKKLIFTSMIAAVGLFAQSNGNAPAAPQKSNTQTTAPAAQAPAASTQAPAQTPAKKHKHKKGSNSNTQSAVKPDTTSKDSSAAPATPVPAKK